MKEKLNDEQWKCLEGVGRLILKAWPSSKLCVEIRLIDSENNLRIFNIDTTTNELSDLSKEG